MCLCVRAAGVLQNISAPAELHRGSVCHRQKWQRAHFHRGEHERQRAARASQRYENLRLWCHICQSCYTVFKNSFNITFTTESVPMYPWKLLFALNVRVANCMNCSLITLKKRLLQTITTLRNHMDSDTILQIEWINTKSIVNKTYKLAAEPSTKKILYSSF